MEIIFLIVAYYVIKWLREKYVENSTRAETKRKHGVISPKKEFGGSANSGGSYSKNKFSVFGNLDFDVKPWTKNLEGVNIALFEFRIKGSIPHPIPYESLQISVTLTDVTGGERNAILSHLEYAQEDTTTEFLFRKKVEMAPVDVGFKKWTVFGAAIKEALTFPKNGTRKIEALLTISSGSKPTNFHGGIIVNEDSCYASKIFTFETSVSEVGYLQRLQNRKIAHKYVVELAMCMSAADCDLDKEERRVINNWIQKVADTQPDEKKSGYKQELIQTVNKCVNLAHDDELFNQLENIIERINKFAEDSEKYEAIELIVDVMGADGIADQAELDFLDYVTGELRLDPPKVRAMRDRKLVEVKDLAVDKDNLLLILGINEDMDDASIRKHLNKEFQRWNSRQTSPDAETQKRANEMLDLIAEARKRYLR
ncbi:MAG: tellurite resistance TerB family protein [Opitutae bacterium]|nr:tellurite resistance TerB family protein [Opitutae bacterium]